MSISLAIAGVVAAGLGLATMSFAFKPLPKPGVPVVISTSVPTPTAASYEHVEPRAGGLSEASPVEDIAPRRLARPHHSAIAARKHVEHAPVAEAAPELVPVKATPPASGPKPAIQLAKADASGEKLCKAPSPQVLSAKSLQQAMSLRYDARKMRPLDIPAPPSSSSDDTERRLKLSALLANMLDN